MKTLRCSLVLSLASTLIACAPVGMKSAALEEVNQGKINKEEVRPACEIQNFEYVLDAKMVAFELTSSTGVHAGFDLLTGFLKLLSFDFKAKSGSMTMAMALYNPVVPNTQLVGVRGKSTFESFGSSVNLGFQNVGAGFDFYQQTPLAKLAATSLKSSFENLAKELEKLQEPWSTEVVALPSADDVIVPVGSFAGLKKGDRFAIYNVQHEWKATPCKSQYLMAFKSPSAPLAYAEVVDLANNAAVLHLLEGESFPRNSKVKILKGARVEISQLTEPDRKLYRSVAIRSVVGAQLSYESGQSVDMSPHLLDQIDSIAHKYGFMVYKP